MKSHARRGLIGGTVLGLLWAFTPIGLAQEQGQQQSPDQKSGQQQGSDQQSESTQRPTQASGEETEIPEIFKKLDLTAEQEQAIRRIIDEHYQKLENAWSQYHVKHMQAIEMEAAWLSAVRDTLPDKDRQMFDRQQQQQQSEDELAPAEETQAGTTPDRGEDRPVRERLREERQQARSAARESKEEQRIARRIPSDEAEQDEQTGDQPIEFVVITIPSPERFLTGLSQSKEQKERCAACSEDYRRELRSTWRDMRRLHRQMVRIEAEKISAIEEQLTQEQLAKLRETRVEPQSSEQESGDSQSDQ